MTAKARKLLIVALLAAVVWPGGRTWGQSLPPAPEPVLPPPRTESPSATPAPTLGPPTAIPNPSPFPPSPGPPADPLFLRPDPGADGWAPYGLPSLIPGLFANVEADILKPHLKAALSNAVTFPDGTQATVRPPTTDVSWTVAPRFEVGYILPQSVGLFAFNYRFITTDGRQDATSLEGTPFSLRTRLDVNQFAFDYGTTPYSFMPHWDIRARIGVALGDVYFDNLAVSTPQTLFASNNFLGAGPHVRFDLNRHIGLLPGLDLYGRGDLVVLGGQIRQRFRQDNLNPDGSTTEGFFVQRKTQTVPVFTVQAGLRYTPPSYNNLHFTAGYQFEEWWFVGQIDGLDSRGQFSTNGVFLRAAVDF